MHHLRVVDTVHDTSWPNANDITRRRHVTH